MEPESAAPASEDADDFVTWADQRIAAMVAEHEAAVQRLLLAQARAALPPYQPPPEPDLEPPLLLRVPEHVWKRLIIELGRQRLEELLAADRDGVYRWAWGRFRARMRAGEFAG